MNKAAPYVDMIKAFLAGEIPAETFARSFQQTLSNDRIDCRELYSILMQLWFSAESYTIVPGLAETQPDKFITQNQLRLDAEKTARTLARLVEDT